MNKQDRETLKELFRAELNAAVVPLKKDIKYIRNTLYGNGGKGISNRLLIVEQNQKNILGKLAIAAVFGLTILTAIWELIKELVIKKFL